MHEPCIDNKRAADCSIIHATMKPPTYHIENAPHDHPISPFACNNCSASFRAGSGSPFRRTFSHYPGRYICTIYMGYLFLIMGIHPLRIGRKAISYSGWDLWGLLTGHQVFMAFHFLRHQLYYRDRIAVTSFLLERSRVRWIPPREDGGRIHEHGNGFGVWPTEQP
ncbi:hypothetical protein F5Y06DRAFT_71062 [Hypoxylon sp. FL0890]|nr:hypothetical protein F5Y06DRAFT_71062 [Hypoxylon sp. FL0890]